MQLGRQRILPRAVKNYVKRIAETGAGARRAALLLALIPALMAGSFKVKKLKATANSPEYASFSQPLKGPDQLNHALERLTFGPRPGDLASLQQAGLKAWLDDQLHPERVPENPLLEQRLSDLASLGMSIHDTFTHYPPSQAIAAFARGRGALPQDPELRALVERLAARFLQKAAKATAAESGKDPNDDSELDLRVKLVSILRPDQIAALRSGTADEKREVLENIPPEKRFDFAWALRPGERRQLFSAAPVELRRELMLTMNPQNVVASDLSEGKLLRAIYSNHQLAELLDDFWFNHFNVFLNKGGDRFMVPSYEREAIRPHIFGKFSELLLATAKSPAMLFYLDNWQSVSPQAAATGARVKRKAERGLNENYGRELLELHTMGVDGGYTQKDVIEVARCFTGWTIAKPREGGQFEYNDKVHDKGQKVVLGRVIRAGGGMSDGLEVLDILAHHPSTAHFISLKLAQRFVADNPPPSLVDRLSKNFLKTGGDLRQLVETMVTSPEFWSAGAYHAKVKMPFEMVASAVRAMNADVSSAFMLANELQKLGEPLYRKIEPTGYSSTNSEWVSSAALLERMNFALALAHNRVAGVKIDSAEWQTEAQRDPIAAARIILEQEPSAQTQATIAKTISSREFQQQLTENARIGEPDLPSLVAGLALGSPEFQRR